MAKKTNTTRNLRRHIDLRQYKQAIRLFECKAKRTSTSRQGILSKILVKHRIPLDRNNKSSISKNRCIRKEQTNGLARINTSSTRSCTPLWAELVSPCRRAASIYCSAMPTIHPSTYGVCIRCTVGWDHGCTHAWVNSMSVQRRCMAWEVPKEKDLAPTTVSFSFAGARSDPVPTVSCMLLLFWFWLELHVVLLSGSVH
jgi:hypothetical protein